MPWKLIAFIALLIIFVIFSGLNVHEVQVNFGIFSISEVPLFVLLITSFILGTVVTIPFMIVSEKNKIKKTKPSSNKKQSIGTKPNKGEKSERIADKIKDEE
jgi:uncharacterized integral membrane protein